MSNYKTFEINSDLTEVKVMAGYFQKFCSKNQITETDSGLLELVLVEALNNIIIHAYESVSGFSINAEYAILNSKVIITLKDHGKEFLDKENDICISHTNVSDVDSISNESEIQELAEGNWGIGLMNSIADDITRYREKNINILIITKNIST